MHAANNSPDIAPAWPRLTLQIALLAVAAVLNPYTLFGLDAGAYWICAFVLPLTLAAACLGLLALMRPQSSLPRPRPGLSSFIRLSAMLQLLTLAVQWADV